MQQMTIWKSGVDQKSVEDISTESLNFDFKSHQVTGATAAVVKLRDTFFSF